MAAVKVSDDEMRAEILVIYNRGRWPNTPVSIRDGPMRRALIKSGYLESVRTGPGKFGRWCWFLTKKARETLVNVPGSGITRPG